MYWPAYIAYALLRPFITHIRGMERVPRSGPCVIAANHASYIDGPLLAAAIFWHTGRRTRFVVATNQLGGPLRRWFLRRTGMIAQGNAVNAMLGALIKGECVGIFPEGGRTDTGELIHSAFSGVGVLAHLSGAPIVPVGIGGTFVFWSRYRAWPTFRRGIGITVGKAFRVPKKKAVSRQQAARAVTRIMRRIGALIGQRYPLTPRKGPQPWEQ